MITLDDIKALDKTRDANNLETLLGLIRQAGGSDTEALQLLAEWDVSEVIAIYQATGPGDVPNQLDRLERMIARDMYELRVEQSAGRHVVEV